MRSLGLFLIAFFSTALLAVDPPPVGPKNAHCRVVLDAHGAANVREWLTVKVAEAEAIGLPREWVYRLAGLSEKHFQDLMSGKVTNLGTESTKKLQEIFDTILTTPARDFAAVNERLGAILKRLDALPDRKARARALYVEHPDAVPVPSELAPKTERIELASKHYLSDVKTSPGRGLFSPDIISGTLGKHTYRAQADPRERWLQADFEGNRAPGDKPTKVYINIPHNEALPAEAQRMAELAENMGAGAFKFNAVSRFNLPDRMVAYFARPLDALKFAQLAAKDLKARDVKGGGVPYAFRVGDSPVSLGVDPKPRQSWRDKVTQSLARAREIFGEHPNRAELTRRYLLYEGIDPVTWLPIEFAERHRDRLNALAVP